MMFLLLSRGLQVLGWLRIRGKRECAPFVAGRELLYVCGRKEVALTTYTHGTGQLDHWGNSDVTRQFSAHWETSLLSERMRYLPLEAESDSDAICDGHREWIGNNVSAGPEMLLPCIMVRLSSTRHVPEDNALGTTLRGQNGCLIRMGTRDRNHFHSQSNSFARQNRLNSINRWIGPHFMSNLRSYIIYRTRSQNLSRHLFVLVLECSSVFERSQSL